MKQFLSFRLDPANECLWREDDTRVPLAPKTFGVLQYLVDHPDRLITQQELLDALWPDTFVSPQALRTHVLEVRKVLGDDADKPRFIETLPKRGYRFVAAVSDWVPPMTPPPSTPSGAFVGREAESGALAAHLHAALGGQKRIAFIAGEAGAGKTTLLDAFERAAGGQARFALGQCVERYGSEEAYYPVLEAIGQLCRREDGGRLIEILGNVAPTWLVQFPSLLSRDDRSRLQQEILGATRQRMLREICDALEELTREVPLVLVLEDLHWADPSTLDLLSTVARRRDRARLLILGTYRPVQIVVTNHPFKALKHDLLARGLCHEIALEPLDESAVGQYLAFALRPAVVPPGLTRLVHQRSEGNPLFMVALLDHFRARGVLAAESDVAAEIPDGLRHVIETRLDRLGDAARHLMEAASVVGVVFSVRAVAAALGLDLEHAERECEQLRRDLQILRRPESATTSDLYQFTHSLYREALVRAIPPARRARLHQRLGEELERMHAGRESEIASELAVHFEECGDTARAVRYLELSSETALHRFAHAEAIALLNHALDLLAALPRDERLGMEISVEQRLGHIHRDLHDVADACEVLETLAANAAQRGMVELQLTALMDLVPLMSAVSPSRAMTLLDQAVQVAAQSGGGHADILGKAAFWRIVIDGWRAADAETIESCFADRQDALHRFHYSYVELLTSRYSDAYRDASAAFPLLLSSGDTFSALYAHEFMTLQLLFGGELGRLDAHLLSAEETAAKNGNQHRLHFTRVLGAWLNVEARDFAGAARTADAELPFFESEWKFGAGERIARIVSALSRSALGDHGGADAQFAAVAALLANHPTLNDWFWEIQFRLHLAEHRLATRNLAAAREESEHLLELVLRTEERTLRARAWDVAARVALAAGDDAAARRHIDEALRTMDGYDTPLAAWRVHTTAANPAIARSILERMAASLPPGHALRASLTPA